LALSGGKDSTVLAHLLHRLGYRHLAVVYVNHGLRPEVASDETFAATLCASFGWPLYLERVEVRTLAKTEGLSLEEAGRTLRYRCFEQLAERHGLAPVLTAHTLDDQVETILMRLCKGSLLAGLAGIPEHRAPDLLRPLLGTSSAEVLAYARQHELEYREDRTNADPSIPRNALRLTVIPLLTSILNPSLGATLSRTSRFFAELDRHLVSEAGRLLGPRNTLLRSEYLNQDRVGRYYALKELLNRTDREGQLGLKTFEEADRILSGSCPTFTLALNRKWLLVLEHRELLLRAAEAPTREPPRPAWLLPGGSLQYELLGLSLSASLETGPAVLPPPSDTLLLALDRCQDSGDEASAPAVLIRPPKPGDRLHPLGGPGHRTIADILSERRVPRALRPFQLVVVLDDRPAALIGYTLDERYRVGPNSRIRLKIIAKCDPAVLHGARIIASTRGEERLETQSQNPGPLANSRPDGPQRLSPDQSATPDHQETHLYPVPRRD